MFDKHLFYASQTLRQLAPQLQVWFLIWFISVPRWSREQYLTAETNGALFCAPDQRLEVAALNFSAKKGVDIDERSGETEGAGVTPSFESHVVAFDGPLSIV